ncbi:mycoredoxin [Glycomyces arizonensis]|uniref:mycoredoxin n=1 Tax=Glycomyces arizonensis TaxID=256035 RepID=UPI000424B020|nr:mycoredoxin [Glycomyces arizonensis]
MITMYSTTWCGYCKRLKIGLDREGVLYKEVNIEDDPEAAEWVMGVNGGNQTVPTVRGTAPSGEEFALTNPSVSQIKAALGV